MPKLNLEAKNETQKIIKDYLEKNVSDILADKINNGVRIQKDGKTLINKKTLAGCMDFALKEAQKLTEKGARAACIQDSVVFGWAIHFFEEDSIEGTLYNEDGTEYKPPKPVAPSKPATAYTPPRPQPKPQMSLFELMENNATEEKPSENTQYVLQKNEQSDNPIGTMKNRAMMPKRTKNRPKKTCERLPKRQKTCRCLQCPKKRKPFRCRARPSISGICGYRTSIPIISSCSAAEISMRHSAKAHRYSRKISRLPSRAGIAGFWNECP